MSWSIAAAARAGTSAALAGRGPLKIALALLIATVLAALTRRAKSRSLARAAES